MAKKSMRRVLFTRVGWMRFYSGPVPGDERPVAGGSYNDTKIGHEVYNFREAGGRLYGYFQPQMRSHAVALERIDAIADGVNKLKNVLVVFVARRPEGGQAVVGWYKDAEVLRNQIVHSPGKPQGYGHFCSAARANCVLLPEVNRSFPIPGGRGGMGTTNICYPLEANGSPKNAPWIQNALEFIDDYQAGDLLQNPEEAAEKESAAATEKALAQSKGQGFARTPKERRALEDHAMGAATKHFTKKGFAVKNVSASRSYDLLCTHKLAEIHVEVKGTTTDGDSIVLTNNEVKHACNLHNACVLFVLHSIVLSRGKVSGGKPLIFNPWQLERRRLTPVSYTYRLR
jgi:Protein NO VEIN, C-terminal